MAARIFLLALLVLAVVMCNTVQGTEVVRSCGRALFHRVQTVCGSPTCSAPYSEFVTVACSVGISDSQLAELCCPQ